MALTTHDILARVLISSTTGLPADTIVNDFAFHFNGAGTPTDTELDAITDNISRFYNTVPPSTSNYVAKFIGESASRAVTQEIQYFDLSTPGSPRYTVPWLGLGAVGTANSNLPTEVAGVLSFHADLTGVLEEIGTTRPRARRRGRVYIGPLTTDAVDITQDSPLLSAGFTAALRGAAVGLAADSLADGFEWSVYSRADAVLRPVVGGWTDNAPDTQRRRGTSPTNRTVWIA